MKCLSIQQPWANLILLHDKRVENRSWPTNFRGTMLVHTGKRVDTDGMHYYPGNPEELMCGYILGMVDVIGCDSKLTGNDYEADGQWHWRLANPRGFAEPIPYRGQLGLFDVPDAIVADQISKAEA